MNRSVNLFLLAVLGLAAGYASAAETALFTNNLSVGVTMTSGNSDTMQANASLISEGEKTGLGSVRAGMEANYGESTVEEKADVDGTITVKEIDDTTVKNAKLFGNVKKTASELAFGYVDGSILYDEIALIDYRVTIGPGLGAYVVKNEKASLSAEIGPSYIWERVSELNDSYLALRVGERFTYNINDTASIWQSLEYLPKTTDFGDYLINAEFGVESALNRRISLRIVLQDKYDSIPGEDLEMNDLTLIAGLGVTI